MPDFYILPYLLGSQGDKRFNCITIFNFARAYFNTSLLFTEYLAEGTGTAFSRYQLQDVPPAGFWPFGCEKLIPCQGAEHQSCGCLNAGATEKLAIVYNLKKDGKTKEISNL